MVCSFSQFSCSCSCSLHLQLLAKFDDYIDHASNSYFRLPAIPDKKGRLPGQKRPKKVIVHLPPLDPIRFPKLHNPEANGLALDPTGNRKTRPAFAADDDDDAEKTVTQKIAAALRENLARVLDLFRQMDENDDGEISREEFMIAFAEENNLLQGLDVPTSACGALFDEWDADGSGTITFSELKTVLKRRRKAVRPPKGLPGRPRRGRPREPASPERQAEA